MNVTNRQSTQIFTLMVAIATSLVITALPLETRADTWELRTTHEEVPGTREIESGKPLKAIKISKVYLTLVPPWRKVSVLTNLCIGHIMVNDFVQADHYCDQAVARKRENAVSHNNRGVLRAMQGDYTGAQEDFSVAADSECVSVQLVDVSDGSNIWAESYDRALTDIFAVQDEVSAAIIDALKVHVGAQRARGRPTGFSRLA